MDKWYYDIAFKIKIYQLSKQAFEDFFCQIMKAADDNFNRVKATGREGDGSCDGYNAITGDYYLVYSPEDLTKEMTQSNAINKITNDLTGITKKWKNISQIYYVVNDKFCGLGPKVSKFFVEWQSSHQSPPIKLFSMEKLKNICLSLDEYHLQEILGFKPDLSNSKITIEYDVVSNIIEFLENNTGNVVFPDKYIVPDFSAKIKENELSQMVADKLNYAKYYIAKLDDFFDKSIIYNKEDLKNRMMELYSEACNKIPNDTVDFADARFVYIFKNLCYNVESKAVVDNTLVIMALFFESCDIFEEPQEVKNVISAKTH